MSENRLIKLQIQQWIVANGNVSKRDHTILPIASRFAYSSNAMWMKGG